VAAAGIGLDKLGFILGALSVGIGFGLQSVVGNFVSGLILVFERPVRVDDVITSGTVEGTIVEIGIRASRIRDWDGAEVIVPNMELISQQVTNWTLSDSKRRRELFIKVEYGTDPNKVIEIIKTVIDEHDTVIKDPVPMVLFLGFKEFSADFRVLFWVTENMLSTTSSVSIGIYNALKAEGIEIPIPKREILEKKEPVKKITRKKTEKPKTEKKDLDKKDSKPD
jgi:small-conductance mechanosensitive channel